MIIEVAVLSVMIVITVGLSRSLTAKRRYHRKFRESGLAWSAAVTLVRAGQGVIVVDYVVGRSQGLGDVLVWWLPQSPENPTLIAELISERGKLTDFSGGKDQIEQLRNELGDRKVVENLSIIT